MSDDGARVLEARVYLAARFSRRHECNELGHILKARGCVITSRWTKPDCDHVLPTGISRQAADHKRERFALEDVDDVRDANWTISLMEEPRGNSRGGRHIEFGIAIALGHRLTIIGPRETVFHHLPQVEQFDTVEQFVASLAERIEGRTTLSQPTEKEGERAGLREGIAKHRAWGKNWMPVLLDQLERLLALSTTEAAQAEDGGSRLVWHVRTHAEIRDAALPHLPDGKVYGWKTTAGVVYAGEGYPVPSSRFALDNVSCTEVMIARAARSSPVGLQQG